MNRPTADGAAGRARRLLAVLLVLAVLLGAAPSSEAAERGRGKGKGSSAATKKRSAPSKRAPAPRPTPAVPVPGEPAGDASAPPTAPTATASPAAAATPGASSAPEAAASAPRPGKPRVYTFGGLDLEGKLRTPQLLYFRSRMRQELDTSSPARRSFMKELEATADAQGL